MRRNCKIIFVQFGLSEIILREYFFDEILLDEKKSELGYAQFNKQQRCKTFTGSLVIQLPFLTMHVDFEPLSSLIPPLAVDSLQYVWEVATSRNE